MEQHPSESEEEGQRLKWIHTTCANVLFGGVILLNAIVLGVETDHRPDADEALSQPRWFVIDSAFNAVFLGEVVLRIEAERGTWCCDPWNVFDAVLVLIGVADVWVIGLLSNHSDVRVLTMGRVFRLLRLTRILRVLRLFRFLRELLLLLNAVFGAVASMAWSLLLVGMVLVVSAMFTTRLVGHDCCGEAYTFRNPSFRDWFGSVPRSCFTLFQFATLENWPIIARAAFEESVLLVIFIIIFILFTNIMLLNTVAGIVVESVLFIASREEEARAREIEEQQRQRLRLLFDRMDTDSDGSLNWAELNQRAKGSAEGPKNLGRFLGLNRGSSSLSLLDETLQHANMSALDAKELFQLLDADGTGIIRKEDFVESVTCASLPPTALNLLHLSRDVNAMGGKLRTMASLLRRLDDHLTVLGAPARTDVALTELQEEMREDLSSLEERLTEKLRKPKPGSVPFIDHL